MALRKRSTVRRKKVSRASKRPRTTGSGKHPAAKPEGERYRAHNATIADIRARDTIRPHDRWMERFEPFFFSQTGVRGFGIQRHSAPLSPW
jgi:hypothetical protein